MRAIQAGGCVALTKQDKQDLKHMMVETFNEGLEQVVMPVLNEVLEKVTNLEEGQARVEETTERIERVQEREVTRADTNERRLDAHDKDLRRIKAKLKLAA